MEKLFYMRYLVGTNSYLISGLPRIFSRNKRIVFFDVTPIKASPKLFYSTQASIDTLRSLIELLKLILKSKCVYVEIALKPKRPYSRINDAVHIELINHLKNKCEIILLSSESDLYHEISNADMVLAPPFSSPCVVAKELEIPSMLYFRSDSHWKLRVANQGINVALVSRN